MIEKRWVLISPPLACADAIRLEGAGEDGVNGDYCPDGTENGHPVWTRVGGTRLADSIYWAGDGMNPEEWWITLGGVTKYVSVHPSEPPASWIVASGAPPAPTYGTALQTYRSVNPANLVKFTEEPDLSIGLIARRRKLGSDIVFTGDDYAFFLHYQRRRGLRCDEFYIRREWKCGGVWREVWTGVFSVGSGEWDHDLCQFSVRPEPYDRYTCLLAGSGEKVNLMEVEPVTATAVILPALDLAVCNQSIGSFCEGVMDIDLSPLNEYQNVHSQIVTYCVGGPNEGSYQLGIFLREKQTTECINGNPVPPPGAGWVLLDDNCATTGFATYVRNPTIAWTFGDATIVKNASPDPTPPDDTCAWAYVGTLNIEEDVDPFCTGEYHHVWVCLDSGDTVDYTRSRPLQECLWLLVERTGCQAVTGVVSDFFEWNPIGDTPGYVAGQNYVTGETNQVDHLVILQKSDAIDPAASNPATIGEATLKEVLQFLAEVFRVYWAIDDDGNLRLEHISAWSSQSGLNLTTYPDDQVIEPKAYAATSAESPRVERLKWAEAQGRDFVGSDILYSGPCAASDNEKAWNAAPFTSDISYISSDPDAIAKEGFAILACRMLDDLSLQVIIDNGAITGNYTTNAPLSTANIQAAFWRDDRYLWSGRMNGQDQTFRNVTPNIQQKPVLARMCCDVLDLDPGAVATTRLGVSFFAGALGVITRIEINEEDDWATLTLRYSV